MGSGGVRTIDLSPEVDPTLTIRCGGAARTIGWATWRQLTGRERGRAIDAVWRAGGRGPVLLADDRVVRPPEGVTAWPDVTWPDLPAPPSGAGRGGRSRRG